MTIETALIRPIGSRRDNRFGATTLNVSQEGIDIIGFIGHHLGAQALNPYIASVMPWVCAGVDDQHAI